MDLLGCYDTFIAVCKPILKLGLLKIVTHGLYPVLEDKYEYRHLTENRSHFYLLSIENYLKSDYICLFIGSGVEVLTFFMP